MVHFNDKIILFKNGRGGYWYRVHGMGEYWCTVIEIVGYWYIFIGMGGLRLR